VDGQGAEATGHDAQVARKVALRRATRAARSELGADERAGAQAAAVDRLERLPELRRARAVLLYAATEDELDVTALVAFLHARRAVTRFPRVAGDELELVTVTDLDTMRIGYRGVAEPAGAAATARDLDVVLVPGVAFDPTGGRLGQGGGHYDRLLAGLPDRIVRVGVGFACQLVPRVPRAAHDRAVDLVVTDRATYRTRARHRAGWR
jgi:5-formyltetrahydrofolate cyclo-ligase